MHLKRAMICVAFLLTTLPSVEMLFVRACLKCVAKTGASLSGSRCFTDFCFFEKGYELFCLFQRFSQLCFLWTLEILSVIAGESQL